MKSLASRVTLQRFWTPIGLSILAASLAFFFRLPFVFRYDLHFGGDAATCYLMARRILSGHHTPYFYGQDYYGSLEQYVTAFLFWLFGPSIPLGGLVPLAEWSVATGLGVYLIASSRSLPAAAVAALVAVIGVPYTLHYAVVPMNGYVPGVLVPLLLLWIFYRAAASEQPWPWLAMAGGVSGLGWYTSKLILPGLLALLLVAAWVVYREKPWAGLLAQRSLYAGGLFLVAFVVGYLPEIIYRAGHAHRSFAKLADLRSIALNLLEAVKGSLAYFNAQPMGRIPESIYFFIRPVKALNRHPSPLDLLFMVLALMVLTYAWFELRQFLRGGKNWTLAAMSCLIFINIAAVVLSAESRASILNARRYLYPSALVLSFMTGLLLYEGMRAKRFRVAAIALLVAFVGTNLVHTYRLLGEPDQLREVRWIIQDLEREDVKYGVAHFGYALLIAALTDERVVFGSFDVERIEEYGQRVGAQPRIAYVAAGKKSPPVSMDYRDHVYALRREGRRYADHFWALYEKVSAGR